jgi:magnesium transporter
MHHPSVQWEELLEAQKEEKKVHWFNVETDSRHHILDQISASWDLHPLLLEDILDKEQLPKYEVIDGILYFSLKMIWIKDRKLAFEHLSFLLKGNQLLTIQDGVKGDVFDQVRNRLIQRTGKVHQRGADFLLLRLLNAVMDSYHVVLDDFTEQIQTLESELLLQKRQINLFHILEMKRQWAEIRKWIAPLSYVLRDMKAESHDYFEANNLVYINELQDQIHNLMTDLELAKDSMNNLVEIHRENQGRNTNDIMKTLTVISAIFIPLTFIVGVYGMNFEVLPELKLKYGYLFVWIVMIIVAVGMRMYFVRRKWW